MSQIRNDSNPIKVLHIISGDLWAGAEVQAYNTLLHLSKDKSFSLACILFNNGILKDKIEALDLPCMVLDESDTDSYHLLLKLIKLIRNIDPHIIHVHKVKEHFLSRLSLFFKRVNRPIIRTLHGVTSNHDKLPLLRRIRSDIVGIVDNLLLRYNADAVIVVSKDLENYLVRSGRKKKNYQIYNAIDIDSVRSVKHDRNEVRNRFGIKDQIWIGTAARLVEIKNIPMLIESGKYMADKGIPFRISIFGDGPLNNTLSELITKHKLTDRVVLEGFESNILPIIKSLDVFVLTSYHEGLPMALLEAMALGTPVVCTNVGGMAEVIENGVNGLLVPSGDSMALADALIALYKDKGLAPRLTQKASETVTNKYTMSTAIDHLRKIYRQILNV